MAQEVCKINKFGYCYHGELCRYLHVNVLCESISCDIVSCEKRHPFVCKFYRDHGMCKFSDYCKYKHEKNMENGTKSEINSLKEKVDQLEKNLKQKDKDFDKLNKLVQKLSEKMNNSEKQLDVIDENDSVEEIEISNLETTFINPSSEVNCDFCDFVAKNLKTY